MLQPLANILNAIFCLVARYLGMSVTHSEASEAEHTAKLVKLLLKKLSLYPEKKLLKIPVMEKNSHQKTNRRVLVFLL